MIKASEIRLGNLITDIHASQGSAFEVIKITPDRCHYGAKFHMQWKDIKGIELTPEWLERFGFMPKQVYENISNYTHGKTLDERVNLQTDGDKLFIVTGYKDGIEIKYVHQLQNLFFALTGRELELKK